jgi:hypothetical protein
MLATTAPAPHAAVQCRLHVGDLYRPAGLDEDERHGIHRQQRSKRASPLDVRPRASHAGSHRIPDLGLDMDAQVGEQRGAEKKRADVDQQRNGHAGSRRHHTTDHRPGHERDREGDVQRSVRASLGLLLIDVC